MVIHVIFKTDAPGTKLPLEALEIKHKELDTTLENGSMGKVWVLVHQLESNLMVRLRLLSIAILIITLFRLVIQWALLFLNKPQVSVYLEPVELGQTLLSTSSLNLLNQLKFK